MNTRVRRNICNEVQTGIDIVKEQLDYFTGDTALKQSDINPRGTLLSVELMLKIQPDFQPSPGIISCISLRF